MTSVVILPRDSDLFRRLHAAASERRCVFFAGLPGVGKSLLLQQLCLIAGQAGRRVHLLQWDVARGPFETPEILARYPERDGVTHAVIRKAVGLWARAAVGRWHAEHPDRRALLVGEVPLIGNRLIELAQRQDDASEALLAGPRTLFLIPVPSREVRRVIEAARVRQTASPGHERERANAVPSLVRALWVEVAAVARAFDLGPEGGQTTPQPARPRADATGAVQTPPRAAGAAARRPAEAPDFDPDLYAAVYARLLRHRHAERLDIAEVLPVQASVYDALDTADELLPTADEVARVMAEVSARPDADVEREVAGWFRV